MRTEKNWNERVKSRILKKFTPRLQEDLKTIPTPKSSSADITSTFIFGLTGVGKTVNAAFMMLEEEKRIYLTASEDKCVFVSWSELELEIKSCFNDPNKSDIDVVRYYQDVHFLVLDDLLTTKTTDWVLQILYLIVNYRYEHMKKTIYTSNKSLDEIAKDINDTRITSRIERQCIVAKKSNYKK